ncbi:MAG: hypothetical protein QM715_12440 [Nibricoccus sp.]
MPQPQPDTEIVTPWFIFTHERGYVVNAETVTKAISQWRKSHKIGYICGVIRGAVAEGQLGAVSATAIYGVICCGGKTP